MTSDISLKAIVPPLQSGQRFDQIAVDLFPGFSRSRIQTWIRGGELTADGRKIKPNTKLLGGEQLILEATLVEEGDWQPQDISLNVVYEDDSIIVINKPDQLVVHPAAGNWDGTLLNGLLFHYPELATIPRAGIVHRLDKDTTGLMVVARTLEAQNDLVAQLQERSVKREYQALVMGECAASGMVDAPLGRHPTHRTKMAVVNSGGKPAITHFTGVESFNGFSHMSLALETGRTHQIRVHMAHIGHPLLGDQVYGQTINSQQLNKDQNLNALACFPRQALHAAKLGLVHPKTGEYCQWETDLPDDFKGLLSHLSEYY